MVRGQDRADLFWIHAFGPGREAFEVDEDDAHDPALLVGQPLGRRQFGAAREAEARDRRVLL